MQPGQRWVSAGPQVPGDPAIGTGVSMEGSGQCWVLQTLRPGALRGFELRVFQDGDPTCRAFPPGPGYRPLGVSSEGEEMLRKCVHQLTRRLLVSYTRKVRAKRRRGLTTGHPQLWTQACVHILPLPTEASLFREGANRNCFQTAQPFPKTPRAQPFLSQPCPLVEYLGVAA